MGKKYYERGGGEEVGERRRETGRQGASEKCTAASTRETQGEMGPSKETFSQSSVARWSRLTSKTKHLLQ